MYAEHNGAVSAASPCTQVSDDCNLIGAVAAERATLGLDTIHLDAGDHVAPVFNQVADAGGLILQGAGSPTRIVGSASTSLDWRTGIFATLIVKNLVITNSNPTGGQHAVDVHQGEVDFDNVVVERKATTSGTATAVNVNDTGVAHFSGSLIVTEGSVNVFTRGTFVATDSQINRIGVDPAHRPLIDDDYQNVTLTRTALRADGDSHVVGVFVAPSLANQDAKAQLQDVTITDGGTGVEATRVGSGNSSAIANLDHVTIIQTLGGSAPSVQTDFNTGMLQLEIHVRNSILSTAPSRSDINSAQKIFCDYTAVPDGLEWIEDRSHCSADSAGHNDVNTPAATMVEGFYGHLLANSPAIDAADPQGFGVPFGTPPSDFVESQTDLAGAPRIVRGLCGANPARRDLGAYEYQGASTDASGAITGPASLVAGASGAFGFTSPDVIATQSWSFGDGTTSSDAAPVHAYSVAGAYTVSLTLTPATGCPATVTKTVDVTAPPAGGGGGGGGGTPGGGGGGPDGGGNPPPVTLPTLKVTLGSKATAKAAAKIAFTANLAGTITAKVTQKVKGYRKSKRATCGTLKHGKRSNCTRVATVATVRFTVAAGTSAAKLTLPKKLKSGSYSVSFTLTAGGKTSIAVTAPLRYKAKAGLSGSAK